MDKASHHSGLSKEGQIMGTIEEKIRQLPQDLQKEVIDFIEFLLNKKVARSNRKPKLDWIGGLRDYRDQYTALDLQRKASERRD